MVAKKMEAMQRGWTVKRVHRIWAQGGAVFQQPRGSILQSTVVKILVVFFTVWFSVSQQFAYAFESKMSDNEPPRIFISIKNDSIWIREVTPKIIVKDDIDPKPAFTVELDGQPYKLGTPIRIDAEADSVYQLHELRVVARDAAGNESEEVVYFHLRTNPLYQATLSVVEWKWSEEGANASLDAWLLLFGPFFPDRGISDLKGYPSLIPAGVVEPAFFSLFVIDAEGNLLNTEPILPAGVKKCEPDPKDLCEVYYHVLDSGMEREVVAIHYRVEAKQAILRRGVPSRVLILGAGTVRTGDFTFEAQAPSTPDPSSRELLAEAISKGKRCSPPFKRSVTSSRECRCQWVANRATLLPPDVDSDSRSRGCAISPGDTDEVYKINARPSRIDGYGYAFDMCEAQNAMIPTPRHRGLVTSGLFATPALAHVGECCCRAGPRISLNGAVAFGITERVRGDARASIAGVIRVSNDIEDLQAAGGLDLGSNAGGLTINIGGISIGFIIPSTNPATQLFSDAKVRTKPASSVSLRCLTGVWIQMTANGFPFHSEAESELVTKQKSVIFRGYCEGCGRSGMWKLP